MMAIQSSDLVLYRESGTVIRSGTLNNLFPDGTVGDGTSYAFCVVGNLHATESLTSVKAWLGVDSGGGTLSIALANASAQSSLNFPAVAASSLTYSTPTTKTSGITLPDLGPGKYAFLCLKRTLSSSAAKAYPESNRLYVGGTSPI